MTDTLTPDGRFTFAFNALISHEGGYSNDKNDPGGQTKYGITQSELTKNYKKLGLPQDVKRLTLDHAKIYYKAVWWDTYHYNAINSLAVATKIMDMCVNVGQRQGALLLQRACNNTGHNLKVDGIMGGQTIGAVNEISLHNREEDLLDDLCEEQKAFYELIIGQHPTLKAFQNGWMKRAAYRGT